VAFCTRCGAEYVPGVGSCAKCAAPLPKVPAPLLAVAAAEVAAAPRGRRLLAGFIDMLIVSMITAYYVRIVAPKMMMRPGTGAMVATVVFLVLPAAYFVLRDAFGGKSIGKLLTGLTTINITAKRRARLADSVLRNLPFAFVAFPVVGWAAYLVIAAVAGAQIALGAQERLCDSLAGTIVVSDADARRLA